MMQRFLGPEANAKRVSKQIDEDLKEQGRLIIKRKKVDIKLLLLGQAESGKSTLLKQFQLMYKPNSLDQERISWKTVIYFNIVRSIKYILNTLEAWDDSADDEPNFPPDSYSRSNGRGFANQPSPSPVLVNPLTANGPPSSFSASSSTSHFAASPRDSGPIQIANLRRRLSPLVATDAQLADRLGGGVTVSGSGKGGVFVRSGWQARMIQNALRQIRQKKNGHNGKGHDNLSQDLGQDTLVRDVAQMLRASERDVKELWNHPTVKALVAKRRLKLDEWSEFFLKHISRVADPDHIPTTDDILHARIETMGVVEHTFETNDKGITWHLFDVGGARGQRHSWVPYFDDAKAIIFLAPVSAFDQYLEEDPQTNRIDDSLELFTRVCSNRLLKGVHLLLFLNKTDLLKSKLDEGLQVRNYITSFGERSNEYETVVQYFCDHFVNIYKQNNENERRRFLYTHFTNVTDTKATQLIIASGKTL
ncbi:guanine nucleotide-binding protein [Amanita rubescens]|nr:guanine nucleotide-binding protein [Amanita rubescens]